MSPTNAETCPTPETLAAFVEGRLAGAERAAVVAHLERCRDCREIAGETSFFLAEEGRRDAPAAEPDRFRLRKVIYVAVPLAAVLALAVLLLPRLGPGSAGEAEEAALDRPAAEIVRPLTADQLATAMGDLEAGRTEPLTFSGGTTAGRRDLLLGAGVLDLAAAVRTGDDRTTRRALDALSERVATLDGAGPVRSRLDEAREDLGAGGTAPDQARRAAEIEGLLAERAERGRFRLGRFLEAARLAASAGSEPFFRQPATREALDGAAAMELPPPARKSLDEVRRLLASRPGVPLDFGALEAALTDLLLLA